MIHQIVRHMFHFKIMHLADKIAYNFKKIKISITIKIRNTPFQEIITKKTLIRNIDQKVIKVEFHQQ